MNLYIFILLILILIVVIFIGVISFKNYMGIKLIGLILAKIVAEISYRQLGCQYKKDADSAKIPTDGISEETKDRLLNLFSELQKSATYNQHKKFKYANN